MSETCRKHENIYTHRLGFMTCRRLFFATSSSSSPVSFPASPVNRIANPHPIRLSVMLSFFFFILPYRMLWKSVQKRESFLTALHVHRLSWSLLFKKGNSADIVLGLSERPPSNRRSKAGSLIACWPRAVKAGSAKRIGNGSGAISRHDTGLPCWWQR